MTDCYKEISVQECENLKNELLVPLEECGFEVYPFKTGQYNEKVGEHFKLPYDPNTVAFLVVSIPSMFEKTFIPFLRTCSMEKRFPSDLLDQCMISKFNQVKSTLNISSDTIDILHDFDLTPMRRARIIMQTAAHISGAARCYQRQDIVDDPWEKDKKIYGACIHPVYGGWFALRAVFVVTSILCPQLICTEPKNVFHDDETVAKFLTLYNDHWKDGRYRDLIPVKERYSTIQQEYFETPVAERMAVVEKILSNVAESV